MNRHKQHRDALTFKRNLTTIWNDTQDDDPMEDCYCEECGEPLESSQIGLCDNCLNEED